MGLLDDIYEIPGVREFQTKLNQLVSYFPPPPPVDHGTPRKILMVTSHPCSESFSQAIAETVEDAAKAQGHQIQRIDLGLDRFSPSPTTKEHRSYFDSKPLSLWRLPRDIRGYLRKLQWCDTLVLVYPTWWMNTPANLKGFFDRTLLMHHTWELPKETDEPQPITILPKGLTPGLCNIQRVMGISTYGAPRSALLLGGDNGRNMIARAIMPIFSPDCTIRWHGLYDMDFQTLDNRKAFLEGIKASIQEDL